MLGRRCGKTLRVKARPRVRAAALSVLAAIVAATLCWPVGTIALAADEPTAAPAIEDLGVAYNGTDNVLGYASAPGESLPAFISTKGGTVQFDSLAYWNDGSISRNESYVTWTVSDPSIASVDVRGLVTAKADGAVDVTATVPADHSATGSELQVTIPMGITGQSDAPVVQGITIADPDGNPFPEDTYVIEGQNQLTTYTLQLTALVKVWFPDTQQVETYLVTPSNPLSAQVPGLSDLTWSVGDTNMGAIEETLGLYKPTKYGENLVMAFSRASGSTSNVYGSAFIKAKDPDSDQAEDGYHPQTSLTVSFYYQSDESTPFQQVTYSVDDIEEMGTDVATYTAVGQRGWYAFTARGVYLDKLLAASGLNDTSSVLNISFDTFDSLTTKLSGSYVFDSSRCYYPNIDLGGSMQYSEGTPVKPMIALESCEIVNGDTAPNYAAMSDGTRFRMLLGTTPAGGTTSSLIKWISGLHVVVKGSADEQPDPGQGGDDPGSGSGDGNGSGTGVGSGEGSGTGSEGVGLGSGVRGGNAGGDEPQGTGGNSDLAEGASGGAGSGQAAGEAGRSVYRIDKPVNTFDMSGQPSTSKLMFWRVVVPGTAAVLAAGAVQMVAWYRRQTQAVVLVDGRL